ncbi:hypothetical protein, partial [Mycobacterium sp. SMC-4]|uniref:hypothetical protein n=1 Tax=Mycobacterium sp. SMC-4 TaxID=2857059 RepID=UPI003CFCCADA
VKHAASVRPEPESNSPNKNVQKNSNQTKDTKTGIQKNHTPKREKEARQKTTNKNHQTHY